MSAILTRLALLSVAVLLIAFPALAQTPTDVAPFRPLSRDEFRAQVYRQLDALAGRSTGRVIYTGVTIISPDAPNPRHNMAIIVAGDRIEAVTQMSDLDAKAREGAETYDAAGLYAIPGLIDSHVHNATTPNRPNAEQHLRREIYSGVTAVRDMAGDVRALADLSRSALINEIPSPDIYYAALMAGPSFFADPRTMTASLGLTPGQIPGMRAITDDTSIPLAVAEARGTGATGIKIYANLPGPRIKAIIAEARRQGMPVWSHAQVFPGSPLDPLGSTSVSHICMIADWVLNPDKQSYSHSDSPDYSKLTPDNPNVQRYIAALKQSGSVLDATLSVYPPRKDLTVTSGDAVRCPRELAGELTAAAHEAGIPVSAGTDSTSNGTDPWPQLDEEIESLVRFARFTPYEAIVAATRNSAIALGKQDQMGSIEPGKFANIVLLKCDPLTDIGNLRSVIVTIKRGHRFRRSDYIHRPIVDPELGQ